MSARPEFTRRRVAITRLGGRGEGAAEIDGRTIYVPYAVPGDIALVDVSGERGALVELLAPAATRAPAFCAHYGRCGGCATQTLGFAEYAAWKRGLVVTALAQARVEAHVGPLVDAHGEGRRRATFHLRQAGNAALAGFMRARSHEIEPIDHCPVLAPALAAAPDLARAIAWTLHGLGKPVDTLITATDAGLDVDLRGAGPLPEALRARLVALAGRADLARLTNHGERLVERRPPSIRIGAARLVLPPGAFLQATGAGAAALTEFARDSLAGARTVADLFSGVGTFALALADAARVHAVESDAAALAALAEAARGAPGLKVVTTERRDLFRQPLSPAELDAHEAILFDPPRAGARAQAEAIAASAVARVVAISCHPGAFARDAALLIAGGYRPERVTPIDQFRHSAHVEIAALFTRAPAARTRRRPVFG